MNHRFTEGDIQFARELINRIGHDECRPFIDFALASAKSTKFEVKTLRGIEQYLVSWEANKEQRNKARLAERERVTEARRQALKDTYETMARRRHATDCLEALTEEARAVVRAEAEKAVIAKSGSGIGFATFVAIEEPRIALQRDPIPSFEEWELTQR